MTKSREPIEGVQVLLATPMTGTGALDFNSTWALIDHVLGGGLDGMVLLGSTGEFFSLSETERRQFVERVIPYVARRVPVGVCPGLPGTEITIELAQHAERCGADYLLVPIPFYFANTLPGSSIFTQEWPMRSQFRSCPMMAAEEILWTWRCGARS